MSRLLMLVGIAIRLRRTRRLLRARRFGELHRTMQAIERSFARLPAPE